MRLVDLFIDDKDVLSVLLRFLDYQDCKILSSIDRMSAQSPLRAKVFEHSVVRLPFPRLQEDQVDWQHYYTTTFMRGANPAMLEHITSVSIPHSNLATALKVLPYLDTVCIWSVPRQALKDQQKRRRRRRENELRVVREMNLHDFVDLTMLSDLHLHRSNVVAFPAIAQLTNLTSVDLSSARLEDTGHFKYLAMLPQLQKLNLCGTRVRDARFLRALDKLKWLDIEGTKISTLADLNHLHGLEYLNISDIWLQSGVISLVHMKALRQLLASYIGAFEPLSLDLDAPDLQKCDLRGSTVQHLEFLQKSPSLKTLDIRETRILNLTSIGALRHLKKLVLTANPVALRSVPWSELTLLEDLHVEKWHAAPAEYEVIDGSLFSSLRSLHTLQIEQMSDFSWIAFPSTSLKRVMMKTFSEHDEDRLVELASSVRLDTLHIRVQHRPPPFLALQALAPTLLELRLVDAVTEDFSVLAECVNLEMLDLTVRETPTWRSLPRNVDFQFLTKLKRLRVLWLTGRHDFKDVSLLKVLKKLEVLRLDRTRVTDVSAVATLTNLRQLSLDCTKITTVPDLHALLRLEAIGLPLNADCRVFHALGAFPKLHEIWHEEGYNCFWTGHSLELGSHK
ncbi:hypothetical protein Poli38472_010435 [Pythium oligandrum]|uniref:Uncharacterized protein n=1 Tax=Pythium oligandrum TaxID=41045 RepID=A0A8K1C387_PYTOL|nr:hypothetical protein Poli38472_010435 [Pythium oligandrum]|eukprot:TMW55553.1 hypothetical protein Poli38472_010435 [Pythium oligandrum]